MVAVLFDTILLAQDILSLEQLRAQQGDDQDYGDTFQMLEGNIVHVLVGRAAILCLVIFSDFQLYL